MVTQNGVQKECTQNSSSERESKRQRVAEGLRDQIRLAQTALTCTELQETLTFYTDLGFKVESIYPADDPAVAELVGHGTRLRLTREAKLGPPARLRLLCDPVPETKELVAPNGTLLEFVPAEMPLVIPELQASLVLARADEWGVGRAGMRYRDLIPGRWGGRFIASLIHIPEGGPVPDYVHFHNIRLQFIYVVKGWVRVVYEDQGEPFVMQAGDCVLQPPKIRHRVLESGGDLYVVEVGCPAEHETRADPNMELPNGRLCPVNVFAGQKFCRHIASEAISSRWRHEGFSARDTGIGAATFGLGGVRVVTPQGAVSTPLGCHKEEFLFSVLLQGGLTLRCEGQRDEAVNKFEAFTLPAGLNYSLIDIEQGSEWLEVTLPADLKFHLKN